MFGYLLPDKSELKFREYDLYESVYCGLCRHLEKDYGLIARITLSYDAVVFVMLALSLDNSKCKVTKAPCRFNPTKKCLYCDAESKAFKLASALSVMMTYYKLIDAVQDGKLLQKTGGTIGKVVLSGCYKKAVKAYPEIDSLTKEMMQLQKSSEDQDAGIDNAAEPSAKVVSKVCRMLSDDEFEQHILEVFGYYVGRWIYLMDAADDLESDIKHNRYNPFIQKYEELSSMEETMKYCNEALNLTASQLVLSYELLTPGSFREILDNIVYKGLPLQQKKLLFDKYVPNDKKKDKNRDYASELM